MLMEFSAACIYDGNLKNGVDASKRPRPNGLPWPGLESPAMFLESNVEEHLEGESKANHAEALKVKDLVRGLLQRGEVNVEDIGVVTPYKGQVRVLRKIMHQQNSLMSRRRRQRCWKSHRWIISRAEKRRSSSSPLCAATLLGKWVS